MFSFFCSFTIMFYLIQHLYSIFLTEHQSWTGKKITSLPKPCRIVSLLFHSCNVTSGLLNIWRSLYPSIMDNRLQKCDETFLQPIFWGLLCMKMLFNDFVSQFLPAQYLKRTVPYYIDTSGKKKQMNKQNNNKNNNKKQTKKHTMCLCVQRLGSQTAKSFVRIKKWISLLKQLNASL